MDITHYGRTLIRRGTAVSKNSSMFALELAIPFGVAGFLLIEIARRNWSNKTISNIHRLKPVFTLPTFLSFVGLVSGIAMTALGSGLVGFGYFFNSCIVKETSRYSVKNYIPNSNSNSKFQISKYDLLPQNFYSKLSSKTS